MCAILILLGLNNTRLDTKTALSKLKHRGPDSYGIHTIKTANDSITIDMLHTRLHIVGDSSPQPINKDNIYLLVNGEIFNWKDLESELNYTCTQSDCEILIPLYVKYVRNENNPQKFFEKLNGQFSFFMYDSVNEHIFVGRDHIGITPMYYGTKSDGDIVFSSELKAIESSFDINVFEPRSFIYEKMYRWHYPNCDWPMDVLNFQRYLDYTDIKTINDTEYNIKNNIKQKLESSVKLQLNLDESVDFGVLLSLEIVGVFLL